MIKIFSIFPFVALSLCAQVEIFGLRTYANDDEYRPPIIAQHEQVTIEFDVTTPLPPYLNIIFKHATKDWVVDDNIFLNYQPKTRSENLSYSAAPGGVYHYTYRYKNSFPNNRNFVEFVYSGNYIYTIVNRDAQEQILAEGKFIIAETAVSATMKIENKYHPDYTSPMDQMNTVSVFVSIPSEYTAADEKSIYHADVKTVDIIKNWSIEQPARIDADDRNTETFVEDLTKPSKTFRKRDIPAGNEYRRMDISSPSLYPNNALVVLKGQPDVSRYQWQSKPDANGASKLKAFTGANSDYLEVEMRLRLAKPPKQKLFLVGGFTEWKVLPEYELKADSTTGLFMLRLWVRRGVHDYQYVLGDVDELGEVTHQDWVALEGNDWRTINRYTALVYYHDQRLGGFDRVIGYVRGRNPGTSENNKSTTVTNP
jgi:hypothetical protein